MNDSYLCSDEDLKAGQLKSWLIAEWLANPASGDWRTFRDMSNRAKELRRKLQFLSPKALYEAYNQGACALAKRLTYKDQDIFVDGHWEFQIDKSFNDEYLCLLECFTKGAEQTSPQRALAATA